MSDYQNIAKVKAMNYDRLDMLVSDRIGVLKMVVQNLDNSDLNEAMCRDLILPAVYLLGSFLESVKVEGEQG